MRQVTSRLLTVALTDATYEPSGANEIPCLDGGLFGPRG